jgi:hypothetical protein
MKQLIFKGGVKMSGKAVLSVMVVVIALLLLLVPAVFAQEATAVDYVETCEKHGTIAWHADNLPGEVVYGPSIIGGLGESCWIVAQVWDGKSERWVVGIRPKTFIEIAGHKGGTGWYFNGEEAEVKADLEKQSLELKERDGPMMTTLLILPDQISEFRLVTRWGQEGKVYLPVVSETTAGVCNIGGESRGPVILEGLVNNVPTVIRVSKGSTYSLEEGGCFSFSQQEQLEARWPFHKSEFLQKYPEGQALEY